MGETTERSARRARGGLFAVAWALALGCASPTLPLPPPVQPSIGVPSSSLVHLSSVRGAEPNALIVIVNKNPAVPLDRSVSGTQADPVGSWDADVPASSGDPLDITQEFGTMRSAAVTVVVP